MTLFAEMETAMNAAIIETLADAVADFGGGVAVAGLFRAPPAESFGLIGGNKPSFEALSTALAAIENGDTVAIGGTAYTVAEQRRSAGMTTLYLEAE